MRIDLSTYDIRKILIEKFGEEAKFKLWLNEDGRGWELRTGNSLTPSDLKAPPEFNSVVVEMGKNCGTVVNNKQ